MLSATVAPLPGELLLGTVEPGLRNLITSGVLESERQADTKILSFRVAFTIMPIAMPHSMKSRAIRSVPIVAI